MPYLDEIDEADKPNATQGEAVPGARVGASAVGAQAPAQSAWQGPAPVAPGPEGNGAGQGYASFLDEAGPTQTGFLNFERFGAANEGVAQREAKRINEGVANQAHKAKREVQGVNDAYLNALNGAGDSESHFDEAGNWTGGAAGPQPVGGMGAAGVVPPGGADYRGFLEEGSRRAGGNAEGVPDFTDTEGYEQAGNDVREADRQLGALGTDEGLAELSGGNWADAALLGATGRQAFKGTRDAYGKAGTGHDTLGDYANAVADNATQMGQDKRNQLAARGSEYDAALQAYDASEAAKGAALGADATPADATDWHSLLDDFSGSIDPAQAQNAATSARGWAADFSKYPAGRQIAEEMGLSPEAGQAKWTEFRDSLPESTRDYIDGMLGWLETQGDEPNLSGKSAVTEARAALDAAARKLQALFRAWLSTNRSTETRTGGGLESTTTRNG